MHSVLLQKAGATTLTYLTAEETDLLSAILVSDGTAHNDPLLLSGVR